MPRHSLVVRVFVASPSDVRDEREQLETLISEMNKIWGKTLSVIFELIKWETDIYPAFGSDPQSVINSQLDDDYDVFIGILWSKFGTKTPRAESGTLEEFERAYSRLKSEYNKPEIMMYFKDTPLPPSKISPADMLKIQEFKESISSRGGIYGTFEDATGFQSSLRAHLSAVAQKFMKLRTDETTETGPGLTTKSEESEATSIEIDDLGYLDFMERFDSISPQLITTLEEINTATIKLGRQIGARAVEIRVIQNPGVNRKAVREIIRSAAQNMETYAKILDHKVPLLSSLSNTAFDAVSNALALQGDLARTDPADSRAFEQSLNDLLSAIESARAPVTTLRDTITALPRLASEINRAKRATANSLNLFLGELNKMQNMIVNLTNVVRTILLD
jgi:hypothetical protein